QWLHPSSRSPSYTAGTPSICPPALSLPAPLSCKRTFQCRSSRATVGGMVERRLSKRAGNALVKFAAALVRQQAKAHLGDEAIRALAEQGINVIGEQPANQISALIDDRDKALEILVAFDQADEAFAELADDERLKQAIISMPLAGIESLASLALKLPRH